MARISRRRNRAAQNSSAVVSLTPLIDTALTLLVIFMVATPMMHRGIKVELPQSQVDEVKNPQKKNDIIVDVEYDEKDKNLKIYVNDNLIAQENMVEEIKKLAQENKQDMVIIKAGNVPYNTVMTQVIDKVKYAGGITNVALATQRPHH